MPTQLFYNWIFNQRASLSFQKILCASISLVSGVIICNYGFSFECRQKNKANRPLTLEYHSYLNCFPARLSHQVFHMRFHMRLLILKNNFANILLLKVLKLTQIIINLRIFTNTSKLRFMLLLPQLSNDRNFFPGVTCLNKS